MKKIKEYFALPFFIMVRPIEGFKRIKYEKAGKWSHAILFLAMLCVSYTFQKQYRGFVLQKSHPLSFNLFFDITQILIVVILFGVANWSVTSLLNGEGKFLDIMRNVTYSFFPLLLVLIPITLVSNFFTVEESTFFGIVIYIALVWFAMLAFMSILVTHNYSFMKTLATIGLTLLAALVITFMLGLLVALVQQVYVFIEGVYKELIYRI